MRWAIGIGFVVVVGCAEAPVEPRGVPEAAFGELENQMRGIAEAPCGSCHTRGLDTAKPEALAVFDFQKERWAGEMSTEELDVFWQRIAGDVSGADREVTIRFVGAAKARRGGD